MSSLSTVVQNCPARNGSLPVWDLVIQDMRARDEMGRVKYGTPLQANNGRDALVDAYQEALDLCVYLRQLIQERRGEDQDLLGAATPVQHETTDPSDAVAGVAAQRDLASSSGLVTA